MRKIVTTGLVLAMLGLSTGQAFAQEKRMRSQKVAFVGLLTTIAGAMVMVPWNVEGENKRLFGDDVCVINTEYEFDIRDGYCETTTPLIKGGLITMGVGAGLMTYGFSKVRVSPMVGPHVVGAKARIVWGR